MLIPIIYIISISFLFNFLLYLWYKFYLNPKMMEVINVIKKYEDRISSTASSRRQRKKMNALRSDFQAYTNRLRNYMFFHTLTVIFVYMIGLFIVLDFIYPPYVAFPYSSVLTPPVNGKPEINTLFLYILSFLLFTPLSLRRPKVL